MNKQDLVKLSFEQGIDACLKQIKIQTKTKGGER